jgi:hypothetical protein
MSFSGTTLLKTEEGLVSVRDLYFGQRHKAPETRLWIVRDGVWLLEPCPPILRRLAFETRIVLFWDGADCLRCAPSVRFLTRYGFVEASALQRGDAVMSPAGLLEVVSAATEAPGGVKECVYDMPWCTVGDQGPATFFSL